MALAARIALATYVLGGAAITLGPRPDVLFDAGLSTVRDVAGGSLSFAEIEAGANVLLFVPLAFLLCRSLPSVRRGWIWLLCVGLSGAVELYQSLLPGRDTTPRDIAANALGAALGVGLDRLLRRRRPAPRPGGPAPRG